MSCYDDRNEPDNVRKEAKKEFQADLDKLTRMLCEAMRIIEGFCYDPPPVHLKDAVSPELFAWWQEHKKLDARRGR